MALGKNVELFREYIELLSMPERFSKSGYRIASSHVFSSPYPSKRLAAGVELKLHKELFLCGGRGVLPLFDSFHCGLP